MNTSPIARIILDIYFLRINVGRATHLNPDTQANYPCYDKDTHIT